MFGMKYKHIKHCLVIINRLSSIICPRLLEKQKFLANLPGPSLFQWRASRKVLKHSRAIQLEQAACAPADSTEFLADDGFPRLLTTAAPLRWEGRLQSSR